MEKHRTKRLTLIKMFIDDPDSATQATVEQLLAAVSAIKQGEKQSSELDQDIKQAKAEEKSLLTDFGLN